MPFPKVRSPSNDPTEPTPVLSRTFPRGPQPQLCDAPLPGSPAHSPEHQKNKDQNHTGLCMLIGKTLSHGIPQNPIFKKRNYFLALSRAHFFLPLVVCSFCFSGLSSVYKAEPQGIPLQPSTQDGQPNESYLCYVRMGFTT